MEDNSIRKGISPEHELRLLRRKIQDTIHPPPVETTAMKINLGQKYTLEPYKSIHDKIDILDEVIRIGMGGGILGVNNILELSTNNTYNSNEEKSG